MVASSVELTPLPSTEIVSQRLHPGRSTRAVRPGLAVGPAEPPKQEVSTAGDGADAGGRCAGSDLAWPGRIAVWPSLRCLRPLAGYLEDGPAAHGWVEDQISDAPAQLQPAWFPPGGSPSGMTVRNEATWAEVTEPRSRDSTLPSMADAPSAPGNYR